MCAREEDPVAAVLALLDAHLVRLQPFPEGRRGLGRVWQRFVPGHRSVSPAQDQRALFAHHTARARDIGQVVALQLALIGSALAPSLIHNRRRRPAV